MATTKINRKARVATPALHTVTDRQARECYRAAADGSSYPLLAWCDNCGHRIIAVCGDAEWAHVVTDQARCEGVRHGHQ